jgi:hypothetical protein
MYSWVEGSSTGGGLLEVPPYPKKGLAMAFQQRSFVRTGNGYRLVHKLLYRKNLPVYLVAIPALFAVPLLAQADVVYSGKLNDTVTVNNSLGLTRPGQSVPDFTITSLASGGSVWNVFFSSTMANQIEGFTNTGGQYFTVNNANVMVDGSANWQDITPAAYLFTHDSNGFAGGWIDGDPHFAALAIKLADGTHYGWARVSTDPVSASFTLVDWAFESTPNTGILTGATPEPSTAALLVGSLALLTRNRRIKGRA